jgi:heme-degrading monooxygenase HmoA
MHARLSTYEGPTDSEQIEEGLRYTREQILPKALQMDGCKGIIGLLDRETGKAISVTLWEDEQAMRASEEEANRLRTDSAETGGETIAGVERYEVTFYEV